MSSKRELATKLSAELAAQLQIPCEMISLHRDLTTAQLPSGKSLQGRRQHTLRWGAFLLIYGALEGYFDRLLGYRASKSRPLPLIPSKIQQFAETEHGVKLFTKEWACRTRTRPTSGRNHSEWTVFTGPKEITPYLADLKSLRDLLSHGGNPYAATNTSGALWAIKKGNSMRIMGVEGLLQAACDLADQAAIAFGVPPTELSIWPKPIRSELSAVPMPDHPLLLDR